MKRLLTTCLAVAFAAVCSAQTPDNMVYNGSFEENRECPQRIDALGIMRGVDAWWQPTAGSSDYFNVCGGRECTVPRNKMGNQEAHSGEAYCGIYCSQYDYREYLQTELREPLKAGRTYRVTFYVSLADKSPHAMATIGAAFTPERLLSNNSDILKNHENISENVSIASFIVPQVLNPVGNLLSDTKGWTEITGTFKAEGGELYMTIGNFADFNHSGVADIFNSTAVLQGAYYYIDDVSVVCLDCNVVEDTVEAEPQPQAGDIVVLQEVYFDVDSYELLPQSYNELTKLISLLNANPDMKIELRGHTDNSGTREKNRRLSENRAKSVYDYITSRGIAPERLTTKGFGSIKPIDTNDTPDGRAHNRRVEYMIISTE